MEENRVSEANAINLTDPSPTFLTSLFMFQETHVIKPLSLQSNLLDHSSCSHFRPHKED